MGNCDRVVDVGFVDADELDLTSGGEHTIPGFCGCLSSPPFFGETFRESFGVLSFFPTGRV